MKSLLCFLFTAGMASVVIAGDAPTKVVKTSPQKFDVAKEVVAFISDLVDNNASIHAHYKKLTAETEEAAGGRFKVFEFEAIEWLVPQFVADFKDTGGTYNGEFVYLARQKLMFGFHHGYMVNDAVVARVKVKTHDDYRPDANAKDGMGFTLVKSRLEMEFDGFVGVKLTPK